MQIERWATIVRVMDDPQIWTPVVADGRKVRVRRRHGYDAGPWVGALVGEGIDPIRGRWVLLEATLPDGSTTRIEIAEKVAMPLTVEPLTEAPVGGAFLGMEP